MVTSPPNLRLSPTVASVAEALGDRPVQVREIVEEILARHRSDYLIGHSRSVSWPPIARSAQVHEWLSEVGSLIRPGSYDWLHGRVVILGLAVLDPPTGRRIVADGLFGALARELREPLLDVLTDSGLDRLRQIPLAASAGGVAPLALRHNGPIHDIAFSPDGHLLAAGGGDGVARVWDVVSGRLEGSVQHEGQVTSVAFSPDGTRAASGGDDSTARVWEPGSESEALVLVHDGPVQKVAFSPDGTLVATASSDRSVRLADATDGREVARHFFESAVFDLAFASDGSRLVALSLQSVQLLGGTDLVRLGPELRGEQLWRVATNPSGEYVIVAGLGGEALLWRPDDDQVIGRVPTEGEQVANVAFTADGMRYVAAGRAVQVGTLGDTRTTRIGGSGPAAISRDGSLVATVDPQGIRLNSVTGLEIASFTLDPTAGVLAFSPDGRLLASGSPDGEVLLWEVGLGERERRLPDYSADDASGEEDLLGIDRDVIALAMLIAARRVDPPLAIGIFGDWGSGKSFFMRRLQAAVARLAAEARASGAMQKDIEFYKHVVQVEFNAWHYAQGELWPSLVETIFANLRLYPGEPPDAVDRRQRELLERAELAHIKLAVVEEKEREAEIALNQAVEERDSRQREVDEQAQTLAALKAKDPLGEINVTEDLRQAVVDALKPLGLEPAGKAARDLADAISQAHRVASEGSVVLTPLAHAADARRRIAKLAFVLLGAPLTGGAVALASKALGGEAIALVTGAATSVATLLSGIANWIRRQASWTAERLARIEEVRRRVEQPVEKAIAQLQAKVVKAEHALHTRQAQLVEAQNQVQVQQRERAVVQAELEAATPSRLRARLIQDRMESGDYRKHLGVLALIRRDFSDLSDYLRRDRDLLEIYRTIEEEEADAPVRINRIVLYIDDLDRCEPEKVIEVLKAVHLLLAFPLFVVVVGVDVRWVLKSLQKEYSGLLVPSGGAAPDDYLEKIFQVPLWLERLTSGSTTQMLRGLVTPRVEEETEATATSTPPAESSSPVTAGASTIIESAPARARRSAVDTSILNPQSLEIGPEELESMEGLSGLLRRSPRTLKRFVNIYRLMKARVEDLDSFLEDRGGETEYRAVMFLLALANSLPAASAAVMTALVEASSQTAVPWGSLAAVVQNLPAPAGKVEAEERESFTEWLRAPSKWAGLSTGELARWAPEVARFSFRRQGLGY